MVFLHSNLKHRLPSGSGVKNLPVMQEMWVQSLGQEVPLRRAWQPTPVFLPGEFHGQRAWWAAVQQVTQSWTQLMQLSTHSTILCTRVCYMCIYAHYSEHAQNNSDFKFQNFMTLKH